MVFEDTGTMDDKVVHLHLEHRVVRRLLGRFIAQGFVYHDLSRACLAQTSDAIPRVVLLGRLCLYGPGAARLHEELIPITARWTDPKVRKGPLTPYAREAEAKTMDLLRRGAAAEVRPGGDGDHRAAASGVRPARRRRNCCPTLGAAARSTPPMPRRSSASGARPRPRPCGKSSQTQQKHIAETAARVREGRPAGNACCPVSSIVEDERGSLRPTSGTGPSG